jgi:hypothetical protein
MNQQSVSPNIDIQALRVQQFGQVEAAYIVGISPQRLVSWYDDGLVPELREQTGRGHRRLHSIEQLAHLVSMRVMVDRGTPVKFASVLAENFLGPRIVDAFRGDTQAVFVTVVHGSEEEYDLGKFGFEVFCDGRALPSTDGPGGATLVEWLRFKNLTDATIVVPEQLAFNLRSKMAEVVARRGTYEFRTELQQYVAQFLRKKGRPAIPAGNAAQ